MPRPDRSPTDLSSITWTARVSSGRHGAMTEVVPAFHSCEPEKVPDAIAGDAIGRSTTVALFVGGDADTLLPCITGVIPEALDAACHVRAGLDAANEW